MSRADVSDEKYTIGPLGERMTLEQIPPITTSRWVARRKAEVVAAIDGGLLTIAAACARYNLSSEELSAWQRDYRRKGLDGLKQSAPRPASGKSRRKVS
jgi:hypothetical protein